MGQTLFDKVWNKHVLTGNEGEPQLLYIDLHLIHEVTSPQAFEGLRLQNRKLRRPDLTFATLDHNVPTIDILILKMKLRTNKLLHFKRMQRNLVFNYLIWVLLNRYCSHGRSRNRSHSTWKNNRLW